MIMEIIDNYLRGVEIVSMEVCFSILGGGNTIDLYTRIREAANRM